MRSRALDAMRPLRAAAPSAQSLRAASRQSPMLRQPTRAASSSSYTPKPRTATSYTAPAAAPRSRVLSTTKKPIPPTSKVNGPIDPQAAIPEAATVADVDPALAASIPTPDTVSTTTTTTTAPSNVFSTALGGSGSGAASPSPSPGPSFAPAPGAPAIDWSSSFHGLSTTAFSPETAAILMETLNPIDIEIKPDGIIYLPEIKYRRILNRAFGPGGWGLAPRGELTVGEKVVTREYALVVHGRFIAQARGECQYFSDETIPTAGEGCKSNALLRCCKDLGIASELWDPRFIREFKKASCAEIWVEHVATKKRRQIWVRKGDDPVYPYQKAGMKSS